MCGFDTYCILCGFAVYDENNKFNREEVQRAITLCDSRIYRLYKGSVTADAIGDRLFSVHIALPKDRKFHGQYLKSLVTYLVNLHPEYVRRSAKSPRIFNYIVVDKRDSDFKYHIYYDNEET